MVKDENQLLFAGNIVSIHESRQTSIIHIISDGNNGSNKSCPGFLFYDKEITKDYKVGDRVTVRGHVQTRRITDEEGSSIRFETQYVGDKISRTKRALAQFIKEGIGEVGGYGPDKNIALFVGTVTHVYSPKPNITLLTLITTSADGHRNFCEISCFVRQAATARNAKKGSRVACVGNIQMDRGKKGETYYSVVAQDIAELEDTSSEE